MKPNWVDVLTAIGTVSAVVVALFGYFLPKLFPPQLRMQLADSKGSLQRVQMLDRRGALPVPTRDAWARYYHVQVSNARRWTKAHNARTMLLRLEEETKTGWVSVWSGGGIPMVWQHQDQLGSVRNIGPSAFADIAHVVQDIDPARTKWLELTPTFAPYGVQLRYHEPCSLRLTLQAQSDESDSEPLTVEIRWNGQWHDGALEMAQHVLLQATKVPPSKTLALPENTSLSH